jgi:hypothetical protein
MKFKLIIAIYIFTQKITTTPDMELAEDIIIIYSMNSLWTKYFLTPTPTQHTTDEHRLVQVRNN